MRLQDYPNGTIIKIGDRQFEKITPSIFWREIHEVPGNCVSRPFASLESMEEDHGTKHVVVRQSESAPISEPRANSRYPARLSPMESYMVVKLAVEANCNPANCKLPTLDMTPAEKRAGNALVKNGLRRTS
jgi:hypothetical protein